MDKPNFDQIVVRTKEEAERIVEEMSKVLERFKVVYFSELKNMVGLDASFIDNRWGWTNLNDTKIVEVDDGFSIVLPPMEPIEV